MGGSDGTNTVVVCTIDRFGIEHCHSTFPAQTGIIQFSVNAAGTSVGPVTVSFDGTSTPASLAAALFNAFPANSVVSISNPNGSSAFTLTTTSAGSSANSATI